jgi:predicted dehydrogenase
MDIIGENGFMTFDNQAQYLTVYSRHLPRNPTWMNYGIDSNQRMINEFVAAIREDREPAVTWRDGYEAVRVALACYESAETGQPVQLTPEQ